MSRKTHALICAKRHRADTSILYGASVNADIAGSLFALTDVNGGLVGGAILTAGTFSPIIQALEAKP